MHVPTSAPGPTEPHICAGTVSNRFPIPVSGKVVSKADGKPVPGAELVLTPPPRPPYSYGDWSTSGVLEGHSSEGGRKARAWRRAGTAPTRVLHLLYGDSTVYSLGTLWELKGTQGTHSTGTAPQVLPEYKWMLNETKPVRDDGVFHLWVPEGRLQLGVKVSEYSRGTLAVLLQGTLGVLQSTQGSRGPGGQAPARRQGE